MKASALVAGSSLFGGRSPDALAATYFERYEVARGFVEPSHPTHWN